MVDLPLPAFSVLKRIDQATELSQWLASLYPTGVITQQAAHSIACTAGSIIKDHHIQIRQTLLQLVGQQPSKAQLTRLGWQLVGRQEEMDRRPIPMVDAPAANGWVAVRIDSISDISWADDKPGYKLSLFAMTGTPAGFKLDRNVPAGWSRFIAYKVGFSRRMEYQDTPEHLVGLYMWAFIVSKPEGKLEMEAWEMDDKLLKHNRAILRLRNRHFLSNPPECPFELDNECVDCTRSTHECIASQRHPDNAYIL